MDHPRIDIDDGRESVRAFFAKEDPTLKLS